MVGKLIVAGTALLLLLLSTAGCPSRQESRQTANVVDGQASQAVSGQDSQADGPADSPAPAQRADGAADEQDATPESVGDTEGEAPAEDPGTTSGWGERPEPPKVLRPGDKIPVDIRFYRATFQDKAANIARLNFEVKASLGRMDNAAAEIEMVDATEAVSAKLDLGVCQLEVFPLCDPINLPALDSQEKEEVARSGYRINGGFQLHFFTEDGELAAIFGVTREADFVQAPLDERPEGFGVLSRNRPDDSGPRRYQVFRQVDGGKTEVLFTVVYLGTSFSSQTVYSPDGVMLVYRFPEGRIEVYQGAY